MQVLTTYITSPYAKRVSAPMQIDRLRRTLNGIKAISPCFQFQKQKHVNSRPKPTNKPIILESDQVYFCPPQVKAKRIQQTRLRNSTVPTASMRLSFWRKGNVLDSSSKPFARGTNKKTTKMAHAPAGTFLDLS